MTASLMGAVGRSGDFDQTIKNINFHSNEFELRRSSIKYLVELNQLLEKKIYG